MIYFIEKINMQHDEIDFEIKTLMKEATAEAKNKNFNQAILIIKEALSKIKKSKLLYSHGSYTKIIPYYQKAGSYAKVEKYCIEHLIPDVTKAIKKGMKHRCVEIQDVYVHLYIEQIYDKLRLSAKRERNVTDESRFTNEQVYHHERFLQLQPEAEKIEMKKEFNEAKQIFGSDTSKWPNVIKKQFESLL
jgi:hypothetical protein